MKKLTVIFVCLMVLCSGVFTASAEPVDNLLMSNCDSTENWSANSQGTDALESDSTNKTEGSGSIGATAMNGKLNQIAYTPKDPIDVSGFKYMEFDVFFSDLTWFSDCGSVMFELTSSGTSDKQSNRYMKKVIRNLLETGAIEGKSGWWHFVLELDNPQDTANGKLNKAGFNYLRFYSVDPISTTPDYTMRLDNIRFTNSPENYTPPEEEGESSSSGKSSSSADSGKYKPQIVEKSTNGNSDAFMIIIIIEIAVIGLIVVGGITGFIIYRVKKSKKK